MMIGFSITGTPVTETVIAPLRAYLPNTNKQETLNLGFLCMLRHMMPLILQMLPKRKS